MLSDESAFAEAVKECDAEQTANNTVIKALGQAKEDYVAASRAGAATTPNTPATALAARVKAPGAPATPATAPAPAMPSHA